MKKILIAAALFMFSALSFSATSSYHNTKTLRTEGYATKQQAYQSGFDLADSLQTMSEKDLKWKFTVTDSSARKFKVTDTMVTVQEFAKVRDQIQYRAVVLVSYQYTVHESSHN
ncbi:DUF3316 domain-containing protein [Vibrio sp. JC009]|uniref:DUF3316 domain-containing protein n=1 Tax=Vibrio sp. JC009 TaxID=2912314 RepID=UPI0023AF2BDF|nr:DUF3316 domain-containing protein [Vibrio sp. JC009]WED23854.1 DUF3316 domain-containing protein [Vibrio sp. JC009]